MFTTTYTPNYKRDTYIIHIHTYYALTQKQEIQLKGIQQKSN